MCFRILAIQSVLGSWKGFQYIVRRVKSVSHGGERVASTPRPSDLDFGLPPDTMEHEAQT